jgi:hypothetical protein
MEAATTVREHDVAGRRTGPGSGPDTRWPGQRQMVRAAQLAFGASVLDCALLETWHGGARVYLFVPAEVPELVTLRAGAVAASILTAIWHILRDGAVYQDLGANHFHNRSPPSGRPITSPARSPNLASPAPSPPRPAWFLPSGLSYRSACRLAGSA